MQLFQQKRQGTQLNEIRRQEAVKTIHRLYLQRVGIPRELHRYETKLALIKLTGFSEDQAVKIIDTWDAASQKRKEQLLRLKKLAKQAAVSSAVKHPQPIHLHSTAFHTATIDAPFHEPNTQIRRVRRAVLEEARSLLNLPLEDKLRSAELISYHQLEIARMEQLTARDGRTIANIVVDKGWVKPETIYFFETALLQPAFRQKDTPLGYYLQLAGLLTKAQVEKLHQTQQLSGVSFEDAAESRGWVKRNTIYFLSSCLNV